MVQRGNGAREPRPEKMDDPGRKKLYLRQAYDGRACGDRPQIFVVRRENGDQALSLGGIDAACSEQLKNGFSIGIHGSPHRIRTRTLLSSALTRTSVPGRLHRMSQKTRMA